MTDISNFFELNQKDDCVYFMGDKLECYISERYANFGYLDISDKIVKGEDGYPTLKSLNDQAMFLVSLIKKEYELK